MSFLVSDCPRCGATRITFDVKSAALVATDNLGWQHVYEAFSVCRHCLHSTVFVLSERSEYANQIRSQGIMALRGSLNQYLNVERYLSIKDDVKVCPPEYLPQEIEDVFREGAVCLSVECFNAAGTMFRLCVDLATKNILPVEDREGLNARTRRDLGLRLPWLFDNKILPEDLRDLSICIKDDGNDAAHAGTLKVDEANDLLDFVTVLLERLYTEPARVRLAKERRESRRASISQ